MQPTFEIPTTLLDNAAHFRDPFFARTPLRNQAVTLAPGLEKTYAFPTFYADVTCAMGIFLCDRAAAQAVLPHPAMKPVRMPGNRALVIFSCYNYRHVSGLPGYNEIAMTIPLLAGPGRDWPVLPLVAGGLFPHMGYYVFGMPVTSRENQFRGNRIWGLPKVTQAIDQDVAGETCVTVAREDDGSPYFTLRLPTTGAPTVFDAQGWIYSQLDGQFLRSQTMFQGTFRVTKHLSALWQKPATPAPGTLPALEIGAGPSAEILRRLQISPQPFQCRFAQTMQSSFDLPDATWRAPW